MKVRPGERTGRSTEGLVANGVSWEQDGAAAGATARDEDEGRNEPY